MFYTDVSTTNPSDRVKSTIPTNSGRKIPKRGSKVPQKIVNEQPTQAAKRRGRKGYFNPLNPFTWKYL